METEDVLAGCFVESLAKKTIQLLCSTHPMTRVARYEKVCFEQNRFSVFESHVMHKKGIGNLGMINDA